MEFTVCDKKLWMNEVPEDEKEKEWKYNVKGKQLSQSEICSQSNSPIDKEDDFWSGVEETEGEAMRRRMKAACDLRTNRLGRRDNIYTVTLKIFMVFVAIGLVLFGVLYTTMKNTKGENYMDPT